MSTGTPQPGTVAVRLRDVAGDDLPIFFAQQCDPEANAMADFPARERDAFMAHWERVLRNMSNITRTVLVGEEVAGNVVCWEQDGQRYVGYWLGRSFWGRGIATAALAALVEQVRTRPLFAAVVHHNVASRRVLEKCGFCQVSADEEEVILIIEATPNQSDAAPVVQILAISGSLRAASSNTAVLQALARVAPPNVVVALYDGLANLPHFNPDLDGEGAELPPPVQGLRRKVEGADGLAISSPEYAHGVPGSLKNALDWLVSSVHFPGKPVALLSASANARHAQASLAETLTVMSARFIQEASVTVPLPNNRLGVEEMLADATIRGALEAALATFVQAIERGRSGTHAG